ncbi:MAG: AsmA family protein [Alphaproteobacteria bacterium]
MKKALYALVALVVIAVLAALVGPSFVDWQTYKADIARELEAATGRRVAIDGDVSLRLLPAPSLRANGVRIANVKGGAAPELARVGTLQMDLALWPLVSGRIVGTGVVLIKPQISLEILANGKPNWLLSSSTWSFGERQLIDDLTLRGGTIRYRNLALGQDVTVGGPEISINGGEPGAPYLVKGTVQAGRSKLTARGSFTRRSGGLYAVLIDVGHLDSASRLRYSGVASLGDRGPRLSGKVTLSGDRPHQFVRALAPKAKLGKGEIDWLKDGLSVTADLTIVGTEASIGGLKIRVGEIEATGQLDASLTAKPQYRVALAFNRLDLDSVMARMAGGAGKSPPRLRLPKLSEPSALTLEVKVNALIFRKEIIRDLHLRGQLEKGKLQLRSLTAQLPGAAELQLVGRNATSGEAGHFAGGFSLNAGNLRGTLDWLGLDTSRVPASRLRRASASGRLTIAPDSITLRDTKIDVDTSRIVGRFGLKFGARPQLSIDANIDRFDVSAYMPRERPQSVASAGKQDAKPAPKAGGAGKTSAPAPSYDWRKNLDAVFAVKVGQLGYAGRVASAASATGTYERGVLKLTRAEVTDLGGVSGHIRGSIVEKDKQPNFDLAFDGRAADLAGVMDLLGLEPNAVLIRLGTVSATGTLSGTKSGAKLKTTIMVAGGQAQLDGDFVPSLSRTKYKFRIALDHPKAEEVAAILAVSGLPADTKIGPVRMNGLVQGDLAKADFSDLKISIGGVDLTAAGAIEVARVRPLLTGEIKTGDLSIAQLLAAPAALIAAGTGTGAPGAMRWSAGLPKEPLFLDGLKALDAVLVVRPATISVGRHKIAEPKVELALRDGVLDVKRVTGRLFGGKLTLSANLRSEKSTLVDAALTLRAADLAKAGELFPEAAFRTGKLDIDAALKSRGISVYGLVAGVNGTVKIKMRNGSVAGFDLAGINDRIAKQADAISLINLLTEGMSTGTTKFDRLDGAVTFVNGVGKVDKLTLAADGGSAVGKGTIALIPGRIDGSAAFRFAAVKSAPPLTVAVSGALDDLKAVFRFNALQRHLMERQAQKR